jgi:lycopene cyclase domain-containing protein
MRAKAMVYWQFLLVFGLVPLLGIILLRRRRLRRFKGTFFWVALGILWVSVPWEAASVGRIWFYSPKVIIGWRILGIPVEEYAFFVIDGLLITTLALLLRRGGKRAAD